MNIRYFKNCEIMIEFRNVTIHIISLKQELHYLLCPLCKWMLNEPDYGKEVYIGSGGYRLREYWFYLIFIEIEDCSEYDLYN